ncbi:hypothetical protein [Mycobacteroides abscessus]|uniref:hypothetical protein n=1 Tax=Mycobacteroides abscessus TaxID=36809 RepID=UPI000C25E5A5|nr:hypothetical protein [Mycobacteroides abscessus]
MTTVGKVELDAAINGGDLKRQLTKEIHDAVLPELKNLNKQIREINKDIDKVSSKPYQVLAKEAGVVADEHKKIAKAIKAEEDAQLRLARAQDASRKAIRARGDARRAERREIELNGAAEEKTVRARVDREKAAEIAIRARIQRETELGLAQRRIADARIADQKRMDAAVGKFRKHEIDGYNDLIVMVRKASDEIVKDALRRSNAQIAEEVRYHQAVEDELAKEAAARNRAYDERERAEEKARNRRERAEEKERAKRERAESKAREKADREADKLQQREERRERRRREMARRGLTSPLAAVGAFGRAITGFAPQLSSGVFSTIVTGATLAAGAVGSAVQSLWLLPAATGAAAAGIGTLVLAFTGFGDVIEAIVSGDVKKLAEEIQDLAPNAQQAALAIQALMPLFSEIRKETQNAFFSGSVDMIRDLTAQYQPMIKGLTVSIATSFNSMFREITAQLLTPETANSLQVITDNIAAFFRELIPSVAPFTQALLDIMEVGSEFLPGLAKGGTTLAENFRDFIREAKQSGKLHEWLQRGLTTLGGLIKGVWDLGRAIMSLAPAAEKILPYVVKGLDAIANLLNEHPTALPTALGLLVGGFFLKGVVSLASNLSLIALSFGTTIPQAIRKMITTMTGINSLATGLFARGGGGLVGGLTAAENGLDRVQSKATGLAGTLRTLGGGIAGIAASIGAGVLLDDVISKNMASTSAVEGYQRAARDATTAQIELNTALLNSGGAWDAAAKSAGETTLKTAFSQLEAQGKSRASWLDQVRDKDGSVLGFIGDSFRHPFTAGADLDSRKKDLDAQAEPFAKASELLKNRFGENLSGLFDQVNGSQDVFNALVKNLRAAGEGGNEAADALIKVRTELKGAAEVGGQTNEVLKKLGEEPAKAVRDLATSVEALPRDVPLNIKSEGAQTVIDDLQKLGAQIEINKDGEVHVTAPLAKEVRDALEKIGVQIQQNRDGTINVKLKGVEEAQNQITGLQRALAGLPPVSAVTAPVPGQNSAQTLLGSALGPGLPVPAVVPSLPPATPPKAQLPPLPPGGQYAVPADPVNPATGKPWTDTERKKAIEDSLNPKDFMVDPWAGSGAPNVLGNGALQVAIPGLTPGTQGAPNALPRQYEPGMVPNNVNLLRILEQTFPGITAHADANRNDKYGEHGSGEALDIMVGNNKALGDQVNAFLLQNAKALGLQYNIWQQHLWRPDGSGYDMENRGSPTQNHMDHVHARVLPGQAVNGAINAAIPPRSLSHNMYATNGPLMTDPFSGNTGYFQVDQQALMRAGQAVEKAGRDVSKAAYDLAVATKQHEQNLITDRDLLDAQEKYQEAQEKLQNEQMDYAETQRGKFQTEDFSKLPFGDPRRILAGAISGAGGSSEDVSALVGMAFGNTIKDAASAINFDVRQAPNADYTDLIKQRNPLAPFAMAGLNVPDYSIAGGGPEAKNLLANVGPTVTANGQMYSDTAGLLDRSFTNLQAALEAKLDQLEAIMNQVKDRLGDELLGPAVEKGVTAALQGIGDELGTAIGNAAGPIIAQAVAGAMPKGGSGGVGGQLVNTGAGIILPPAGGAPSGGGGFFALPNSPALQGFGHDLPPSAGIIGGLYDEGGLWPSGTFGTNLSGSPERVLDPVQTKLFDAGLLGGWNTPVHPATGMRAVGFSTTGNPVWPVMGGATTSGVKGNETVGADFFGVSQVPIIGMIVNLLVRVLLKVIGVEIEVRDTLDEMSKDFRQFRGDFEAFDASGRLMNDTSALLDRSSTSEQAAADERIRILKIVIEGLIKFIIEKLVVPIGKAIANAFINAGAGAAGGAIGASFPGGSIVGGMVSSIISSAGSAMVEIVGDIFTDFSLALTSVLTDMIAELLQGIFPGIMKDFFGGAGAAAIFDPITSIFTGIFGPILGLLSGLGSLSLPGLSFDEGGIAPGIGFLPKATVQPERVLSPQQTASFDRLVSALDGGRIRTGDRVTQIHAPITVHGGVGAGENVRNHLLSLIDG